MKQKSCVFIIEDDKFFSQLVCEMMLKRGLQPVACFKMEDAINYADNPHVSFVLTDIFMPGLGGIEGIRIIKERFPDTKIIAMSGGLDSSTPEMTIQAAKKIGANIGLKKPFTSEQLDQALQELGVQP